MKHTLIRVQFLENIAPLPLHMLAICVFHLQVSYSPDVVFFNKIDYYDILDQQKNLSPEIEKAGYGLVPKSDLI